MTKTLAVLSLAFLFALSAASASEPRNVIHYLHCQEIGGRMDDAVVVNIDRQYNGRTQELLVASVYHRVEHDTILVSQTPVQERQAVRPGAPKEFSGNGIRLEVKTTVAPTENGMPAKLELRSEQLSTQLDMGCYFAR